MKKIYIYSLVVFFMVFFNACGTKTASEERDAAFSNIIIDDAYVILDNEELMQQYRDYNEQLLKEFDIDFRVITTTDESDIDIFTHKAFTALQSESRSHSGKALLMVVNTQQDKVRIEVSMALEPIYTDAYISYVERKGLVPYFRDSKVAEGIYMMTELTRDRASEAREGKAFMPPMESKSIGAGAKTKAHVGIVDSNAKKGRQVTTSSSDTPKDILNKHIQGLKAHNKNPDLDIYGDASKAFFKSWTVTDINQDNEYRFISQCNKGREFKYSVDHQYAVAMNHPVKERTCSPYFFKKEREKWTLDIATMTKVLRFNGPMEWHFDMDKKFEIMSHYEFAFTGLYYDNNGYPFISKNKNLGAKKLKWGFTCSPYYDPRDPGKTIKCWITQLELEGAAKNQLGLEQRDKILSAGEGPTFINNISMKDFMTYMKGVPSGTKAVVTVERDTGKTKILRALVP